MNDPIAKFAVQALTELAALIRDGKYDPPADVRDAVAEVNAAIARHAAQSVRRTG